MQTAALALQIVREARLVLVELCLSAVNVS